LNDYAAFLEDYLIGVHWSIACKKALMALICINAFIRRKIKTTIVNFAQKKFWEA